MRTHHTAAAALLLLPLLAACGTSTTTPTRVGGSGDAPQPAPTVTAPQDATAVTNRLAAAVPGLKTVVIYTAATDPNHLLGRPGGYSSKTAFTDPRVKASDVEGERKDAIDRGGSVEVFPDTAGAQARAKMGAAISKSMPSLAEYDYVHGTVLVRVSHLLTPDQAAAYKRVVDGL